MVAHVQTPIRRDRGNQRAALDLAAGVVGPDEGPVLVVVEAGCGVDLAVGGVGGGAEGFVVVVEGGGRGGGHFGSWAEGLFAGEGVGMEKEGMEKSWGHAGTEGWWEWVGAEGRAESMGEVRIASDRDGVCRRSYGLACLETTHGT